MAKCLQCGACCDTLYERRLIDEDLWPSNAPDGWIQEHWRLIRELPAGGYLYDCDNYDHQTKLCRDYSNRPGICQAYPEYGEPISPERNEILFDSCAWKEIAG